MIFWNRHILCKCVNCYTAKLFKLLKIQFIYTTVQKFVVGMIFKYLESQVKSSHLYLYSAFNNTDCVKALNSIKLEDRVSVMFNNKIKHSIFS